MKLSRTKTLLCQKLDSHRLQRWNILNNLLKASRKHTSCLSLKHNCLCHFKSSICFKTYWSMSSYFTFMHKCISNIVWLWFGIQPYSFSSHIYLFYFNIFGDLTAFSLLIWSCWFAGNGRFEYINDTLFIRWYLQGTI